MLKHQQFSNCSTFFQVQIGAFCPQRCDVGMNGPFILLLLLSVVYANNSKHHKYEECKNRFLSSPTAPTRLNYNITHLAQHINEQIHNKVYNFSTISRHILQQHTNVLGIILINNSEQILALNVSGRLRIFPNRTSDTEIFWQAYNKNNIEWGGGWGAPFKTCHFPQHTWFYCYFLRTDNLSVGLFLKLHVNQCDDQFEEIFNGKHLCQEPTTYVS